MYTPPPSVFFTALSSCVFQSSWNFHLEALPPVFLQVRPHRPAARLRPGSVLVSHILQKATSGNGTVPPSMVLLIFNESGAFHHSLLRTPLLFGALSILRIAIPERGKFLSIRGFVSGHLHRSSKAQAFSGLHLTLFHRLSLCGLSMILTSGVLF